MYNIIDGKTVSAYVKQQVKDEVAILAQNGSVPALAVIIVGNDPASKVYVGNKKKACEMTGMKSIEYALDENTSEAELLELIDKLNSDKEVNGILCQLPLPKHINEDKIQQIVLFHGGSMDVAYTEEGSVHLDFSLYTTDSTYYHAQYTGPAHYRRND